MRVFLLLFYLWSCSVSAISFFQFNAGKQIIVREARVLKTYSNDQREVLNTQNLEYFQIDIVESGVSILGYLANQKFGDTFTFHQTLVRENSSIDLFSYLLGIADLVVFDVPPENKGHTPNLSTEFGARHILVNHPFFPGVQTGETVRFQSIDRVGYDDGTFKISFRLETSGTNVLTVNLLFSEDLTNPQLLSIYVKIEVSPGFFDHYVYTVLSVKKEDDDRDEGAAGGASGSSSLQNKASLAGGQVTSITEPTTPKDCSKNAKSNQEGITPLRWLLQFYPAYSGSVLY